MIFEELKAQVLMLNSLDLHQLKLLVDRMAKSTAHVREFVIGETIEFTTKSGEVVQAKIRRLNDKTISCIAVKNGGKWRVSRSLVRQVELKEVPVSEIINPEFVAAARASIGGMPTAAGAGSW